MPAQLIKDPRELAGALTDQIPTGTTDIQFGIAPTVLDKKSDPPLIMKQKGESMAAFYVRAENLGVGRQCLACGGKRRYSLVQCPYCFQYLASEVRLKPQNPDPETLPVERPDSPLDQPVSNNGFTYTPVTDPDQIKELPDKGSLGGNATPVSAVSLGAVPLDQRSIEELREFAHIQGVELPNTKSRDKILKVLQRRFGAQEPAPSKLPELPPLPSPEPEPEADDQPE